MTKRGEGRLQAHSGSQVAGHLKGEAGAALRRLPPAPQREPQVLVEGKTGALRHHAHDLSLVARDGVEDVERSFEVVGVVEDVRQAGLGNLEALTENDPIMYLPLGAQAAAYTDWQIGFRMRKSFVVESAVDPDRLYPALLEAVWNADPDLPILSLSSLDGVTADSMAQHRFCGLS